MKKGLILGLIAVLISALFAFNVTAGCDDDSPKGFCESSSCGSYYNGFQGVWLIPAQPSCWSTARCCGNNPGEVWAVTNRFDSSMDGASLDPGETCGGGGGLET